jgi:ABC-type oligopeptide transport system substrate-binding subunit
MFKSKKSLAMTGAVIAAGFAFYALYVRYGRDSKHVDSEAHPKLSAFLDWNLTPEGPLADEARTLMTERLIDIGPEGRYIFRLANKVEPKSSDPEHTTTVTVKNNIYWSDQVQLTAQQFADAWERFRSHAKDNPEAIPTDDIRRWISRINLKVIDKFSFEITGHMDKNDLTNILRSRYLIPVRLDLLESEQNSGTAWLTTIGRYRLQALPPESATTSTELEFVPNPAYYRGVARETIKVAVGKLATPEKDPGRQ